jgi:hypothetical protein
MQDWDDALNKYSKEGWVVHGMERLNQAAIECFGLCWKKKNKKKPSTPVFSYRVWNKKNFGEDLILDCLFYNFNFSS